MGLVPFHFNEQGPEGGILQVFDIGREDIHVGIVFFDQHGNNGLSGAVADEAQADQGLVSGFVILVDVQFPDEIRQVVVLDAGHEFPGGGFLGVGENIHHGALFDDLSVFNDGHPVADFFHHVHLVGDHDDGDVEPFVDVPEQVQDAFRGLGIQGGSGFIAEQHFGIAGQGPGDAHPLFLAPGQLAGVVVRPVFQAHQVQQGFHFLLDGGFVQPLDFQREGNVAENRAAGQQVEMLEDHADVLPGLPQLFFTQGGHFLAVHDHLAAGGFFQHVDAPDQGAFAGPGKADDAEDLTFVDGQIDVFQGVQVAGRRMIDFVDVLQFYQGGSPP